MIIWSGFLSWHLLCAGSTLLPGSACTACVKGFHDLKLYPFALVTLQLTICSCKKWSVASATSAYSLEVKWKSHWSIQTNYLVVDTGQEQYLGGKPLHGIYHGEDNMFIPFWMSAWMHQLFIVMPFNAERNQLLSLDCVHFWTRGMGPLLPDACNPHKNKNCGPTQGEY